MLRTLALGIFIGVSNAADPGSGSGSGSGDDPVPAGDNPCFAAETTMACKLTGDVSAAEAHRQCYTIHNTIFGHRFDDALLHDPSDSSLRVDLSRFSRTVPEDPAVGLLKPQCF